MSINLTPISIPNQYGLGRHPKRPEITPQKARQEAAHLLLRLPFTAQRVVDLLSVSGVLTADQLTRHASVSQRTLRLYYQRYLIDRLPTTLADQIAKALSKDRSQCIVYSLGPVGLEIARMTHRRVPTYAGLGIERVAHDVFTAETVLRLAEGAQRFGWEVLWRGKYEATVPSAHGGPALEPDALIVFRRGEEIWHALLEFHNEDFGSRAADKIRRYESIYLEGRWRDIWETDEFPVMLVVSVHRAVGKGYVDALKRGRSPHFRILLKSFQEILSGEPTSGWFDPVSRQKDVHLMPEGADKEDG